MLLALKVESISTLVIVETGISTCKFPIHVYHCAMKNKSLKEPYFQLNITVKLKDSRQLEFYENYFLKEAMILLTVQSI